MNKLLTVIIILALSSSIYADVLSASYNIKWLGYSKTRENHSIANMLFEAKRDLVIIQEVVAPPMEVVTESKIIKADPQVKAFFDAMEERGYKYVISKEDTGTGEKIHINSAATEWFVAFYNPEKLQLLEKGYIAQDRSNHDDYERVPYQFTFKEISSEMDIVLISTHLKPGKGKKNRVRRYHELQSIFDWIKVRKESSKERDYIVLGDMNVYSCDILDIHLRDGFKRANTECLNSNLKMNKPYDQVLYTEHSKIDNYEVIDMYEIYDIDRETSNKEVIARYSDHHPVFFTVVSEVDDD